MARREQPDSSRFFRNGVKPLLDEGGSRPRAAIGSGVSALVASELALSVRLGLAPTLLSLFSHNIRIVMKRNCKNVVLSVRSSRRQSVDRGGLEKREQCR